MENLPKLRFDRTPEWRRLVEKVLALKEKGIAEERIPEMVRADKHAVMRILEDEDEVQKYAARTWDGKIPTIKNIVGMGLDALQQCVIDISMNDDLRRQMFTKVSDFATFAKAMVDLNTLLRLELNQSTENKAVLHAHSYEQTRQAIQTLQKVDPVFEYPQKLPEPDGKQ